MTLSLYRNSMNDVSDLEAEYCPPLDVALFTAIISDFDISAPHGLAEARATLDPLKESASLEEAAGFEPSGVSGGTDSYGGFSVQSSDGLYSQETESTSISNDLSSLQLTGISQAPNFEQQDLNGLDDEAKLQLLREVFADQLKDNAIKSTLQKCKGNWNATMEELLTQVYYNEAEDSDGGKLVVKGVDGFSEERIARAPRRRKKRKARVTPSADSDASDASDISLDSQSSPPSKWQSAQRDIDFLASHVQTPVSEVRIKYNQRGASVPQTIVAFLKEEMDRHAGLSDEEQTKKHAQELGQDFPTIAPTFLLALIRLTAPSTAAAHELAKALVARPKHRDRGIDLIPQYARITDASIDGSTWQSTPRKSVRSAESLNRSSLGSPENYAAARAQAFAQATAAHRKSKSDRLYGGAAAYYSQVARDLGGLNASANSAAMDALVDRQSSATQIDLHGVDVLNGVRIARQRVERWWSGLGESRANGRVGAADRSSGFAIVVGRGTHSEGGKSKLGPAVTKMLKSEGWRIQDEGAVISVMGKLK